MDQNADKPRPLGIPSCTPWCSIYFNFILRDRYIHGSVHHETQTESERKDTCLDSKKERPSLCYERDRRGNRRGWEERESDRKNCRWTLHCLCLTRVREWRSEWERISLNCLICHLLFLMHSPAELSGTKEVSSVVSLTSYGCEELTLLFVFVSLRVKSGGNTQRKRKFLYLFVCQIAGRKGFVTIDITGQRSWSGFIFGYEETFTGVPESGIPL